jgi:transposase
LSWSRRRQASGGESSVAELCRREGVAESHYFVWSKEFLEAGKKRLAGDTARVAKDATC